MRKADRPLVSAHGFTLVEIAIALVIIGLLMGGVLDAMAVVGKSRQRAITQENIQEIRTAMAQYYTRHGHYPCPIPPIDPTAPYGLSDRCANPDTIAAKDAEKRGIYYMPGARGKPVIEGAVPYRLLNIPESAIFDGWDRLFTYAVTETLTLQGDNGSPGQIAVTDAKGVSVIDPPGSGYWVLLSHGPDGAGGYSGNATFPAPCISQHVDGKNCLHQSTYIADRNAMGQGIGYYDDVIFYRTWVDEPEQDSPQYCSFTQKGAMASESQHMVQEGTIVRMCGETAADITGDSKCQFLLCRGGKLVPNVENFTDLSGGAK